MGSLFNEVIITIEEGRSSVILSNTHETVADQQLAGLYKKSNVTLQVLASIVNSAAYHKRAAFLMSNRLLNSLLTNDVHQQTKSLHPRIYSRVMAELFDCRVLCELRKSTNNLASVVTFCEAGMEKLEEICPGIDHEASIQECLSVYDSKVKKSKVVVEKPVVAVIAKPEVEEEVVVVEAAPMNLTLPSFFNDPEDKAGCVVGIIGQSGEGKSTSSIQTLIETLERNPFKKAVFVTCEMTESEVVERIETVNPQVLNRVILIDPTSSEESNIDQAFETIKEIDDLSVVILDGCGVTSWNDIKIFEKFQSVVKGKSILGVAQLHATRDSFENDNPVPYRGVAKFFDSILYQKRAAHNAAEFRPLFKAGKNLQDTTPWFATLHAGRFGNPTTELVVPTQNCFSAKAARRPSTVANKAPTTTPVRTKGLPLYKVMDSAENRSRYADFKTDTVDGTIVVPVVHFSEVGFELPKLFSGKELAKWFSKTKGNIPPEVKASVLKHVRDSLKREFVSDEEMLASGLGEFVYLPAPTPHILIKLAA
jgi:hypothetical protein